LLNLDGISYAKGAGALKQLVAWLGDDAFLAGLRAYFEAHAFGTTTLADLLAALEPASGRDLGAWSREWLETAGVNLLRTESTTDGERYTSVAVLQTAPVDHPTLRSHRIGIGLYDRDGERLVRRERIEVDVAGARTDVALLAGARVPDLMLLNDDDLTWAKIRLDERSMATVRTGGLSGIEDPLARALIWASAWDMTRDAELPAGDYVQLALGAMGAETDISLVEDGLKRVRTAIDVLGRPDARSDRLVALASTCLALSTAADPGSDLQVAHARAYAGAARSDADASRLRGWLDGVDIPPSLAMDAEMRWLIIRRLAVIGAADEQLVATEAAHDPTSNGAQHAAAARTSFPTTEAKAAAWASITAAEMPPIGILRPTTENFWHVEQLDLCAPYVDRILAALPEIWRTRPSEAAWGITEAMFPSLLVSADTVRRVEAALAGEMDDALRRLLVEGRADLARALRARAADR
jgi:aminopeptidase N